MQALTFRAIFRKMKVETMRVRLLYTILFLVFRSQDLLGQCDFVTPPGVKKVNYASREVTFSDVTINGRAATYLAVEKGATVKITTRLEAKQNGDYCPDCIVQVYWGIRGYTSVCAKSFYGYQLKSKKSTHQFQAPMEDGIYYITMGGTLDYSCKNNKYRPTCSPDDAFAVLKVGTPDPEKMITLARVKKGAADFLKTTLIKQGCFGKLDKIEWFLDDSKLAFDNRQEIPLTQFGAYKAIWSNCLTSVADSLNYTSNDDEAVTLTPKVVSTPRNDPGDKDVKTYTLSTAPTPRNDVDTQEGRTFSLSTSSITSGETNDKEVISYTPKLVSASPAETDIAVLIENNDRFVMEHLIFDLSKSDIKPEAQEDLDKLAQIMKDQPSMRILLEGHTDARGSARKNQVLSENRVKAAKAYLVERGVARGNIETKGWGHQKPLIVTKDVEEGRVNRRVEIQILSR